MGDVTVDVEQLREEIRRQYVQVLEERKFHFQTGRRAAQQRLISTA